MHEFFRRAINPRTARTCFKLRLRPLTLGHLFYLHEINSPVLDGRGCQLPDILLAALICSRPVANAHRKLKTPWISLWAMWWGWRCRNLNPQLESQKFFAYLSAERALPPVETPDRSESRSINAPWDWILLEMLLSTYHLTEREALAMAIRRANTLYAVRGDLDGRLNLATAQEGVSSIIHQAWRAAHAEN